jgi:hypothetical protein
MRDAPLLREGDAGAPTTPYCRVVFDVFSLFSGLYILVLVAVTVLAVVLAVLLCRVAIAARENLLTTTRLRELQIEKLLLEDD